MALAKTIPCVSLNVIKTHLNCGDNNADEIITHLIEKEYIQKDITTLNQLKDTVSTHHLRHTARYYFNAAKLKV